MVQDQVYMLIKNHLTYAVSTVGFEEFQILQYIKNQRQLDVAEVRRERWILNFDMHYNPGSL